MVKLALNLRKPGKLEAASKGRDTRVCIASDQSSTCMAGPGDGRVTLGFEAKHEVAIIARDAYIHGRLIIFSSRRGVYIGVGAG